MKILGIHIKKIAYNFKIMESKILKIILNKNKKSDKLHKNHEP